MSTCLSVGPLDVGGLINVHFGLLARKLHLVDGSDVNKSVRMLLLVITPSSCRESCRPAWPADAAEKRVLFACNLKRGCWPNIPHVGQTSTPQARMLPQHPPLKRACLAQHPALMSRCRPDAGPTTSSVDVGITFGPQAWTVAQPPQAWILAQHAPLKPGCWPPIHPWMLALHRPLRCECTLRGHADTRGQAARARPPTIDGAEFNPEPQRS